MKILMADDEPEILTIYSEMLKACEHEVTTTQDGRQALDKFTAGDYDLVVMDLHMPIMDGFECLAEMQKLRQDVPVIVMTGYYPDDVVTSRLEGLGVDVIEILRKPVRIMTLWNVINRL